MNNYTGHAIVCYIDILGFSGLVLREHNNVQKIQEVESIIHNKLSKIPENFQRVLKEKIAQGKKNAELLKAIHGKIKYRFYSDSTLLVMPLKDLPLIEEFKEKPYDGETVCIKTAVAFFSLYIIGLASQLQRLCRGGISIGQYYENDLETPSAGEQSKGLFVFSEALIKAVKMEKLAVYPRIIIDDSVYEHIEGLYKQGNAPGPTDLFANTVFNDFDGFRCLNIYDAITHAQKDLRKKILDNMFGTITEGLKSNKDDVNVLKKYHYFKNYHNRKMEEFARAKKDDFTYTEYIIEQT